jgi:phosphate/sulfate permease
MRRVFLGTLLILYAIFLSPAYCEPTDLVVSTGLIAATTSYFGPELASVIIPLWMATGYIALVFGVLLLGTGVLRRFGIAKLSLLSRYPYQLSLIIITLCCIISYLFYVKQ